MFDRTARVEASPRATRARTRRPLQFPTVARAALLAASLTACGGDNLTQPPVTLAPHVASASAAANPTSALSALVTVTAENADSARVLYVADGQPVDSTPFIRLTSGGGTIGTLGLRPATGYRNVVAVPPHAADLHPLRRAGAAIVERQHADRLRHGGPRDGGYAERGRRVGGGPHGRWKAGVRVPAAADRDAVPVRRAVVRRRSITRR